MKAFGVKQTFHQGIKTGTQTLMIAIITIIIIITYVDIVTNIF